VNHTSSPDPSRHVHAWFLLVAVLGLHVIDEALTGFLGFYDPLVLSIRSRVPWFPAPTFTFGPWLSGLVLLVVGLAALGPAVRRGAPGTRLASWALAAIMLLNGCGHLAGSVFFRRWLPGTTSAPLLVAASLLLMGRTAARDSRLQHPARTS
jgi:Protein of unknown function with HXXEE motif